MNTASRMETTSLPLHIQISKETKQVLDEFGTFIVSLRGTVEAKGKGLLTTWWLQGERTRPSAASTCSQKSSRLNSSYLEDSLSGNANSLHYQLSRGSIAFCSIHENQFKRLLILFQFKRTVPFSKTIRNYNS